MKPVGSNLELADKGAQFAGKGSSSSDAFGGLRHARGKLGAHLADLITAPYVEPAVEIVFLLSPFSTSLVCLIGFTTDLNRCR